MSRTRSSSSKVGRARSTLKGSFVPSKDELAVQWFVAVFFTFNDVRGGNTGRSLQRRTHDVSPMTSRHRECVGTTCKCNAHEKAAFPKIERVAAWPHPVAVRDSAHGVGNGGIGPARVFIRKTAQVHRTVTGAAPLLKLGLVIKILYIIYKKAM